MNTLLCLRPPTCTQASLSWRWLPPGPVLPSSSASNICQRPPAPSRLFSATRLAVHPRPPSQLAEPGPALWGLRDSSPAPSGPGLWAEHARAEKGQPSAPRFPHQLQIRQLLPAARRGSDSSPFLTPPAAPQDAPHNQGTLIHLGFSTVPQNACPVLRLCLY